MTSQISQPIYRYNNNTKIATLDAGATYYPICNEKFYDATGREVIFGPDGNFVVGMYSLVWVQLDGSWTREYIRDFVRP